MHALVELVPPEGQRRLSIMPGVRDSVRERAAQDWRRQVLEIVCVVVVLLAIAALAAWFFFNHGGQRGAAGPF